jgi:sensor histidine kinase YesM
MNQGTPQSVAGSAALEHKSPCFSDYLVKALWIVPTVALFIVVIFLSIGRIHLSDTVSHFVGALGYSGFIAVPSMFLLTWISIRYTARFPRLIVVLRTLILLFTATAGALAAGVVFQIVGVIPRGEYWMEFRSSFPFCVVITLVIGLSTASYETMRYKLQETTLELSARQVEQERAKKLLAEARLSSLESRIHPHFLFNTLNSIASLIPTDPQRAEDTVGRFASLLRFSLNAQHTGLVPLAQELKIVRDYLEIEKTRFSERLRFEIAIPPSMEAAKVPPLALQTLVENCIKHVVARRAQGASIRVAGSMEAGRIRLEVIDDGPGFSLSDLTPEHGLGNLVTRLELLFGDQGELDVTREAEKTVVRISFPAES